MDRRSFIKLTAVTGTTASLAACGSPENHLIRFVPPEEFDQLAGAVDDAEVLSELAREEGDESQEPEIEASLGVLARKFDVLEMRSLFTGDHDTGDAKIGRAHV